MEVGERQRAEIEHAAAAAEGDERLHRGAADWHVELEHRAGRAADPDIGWRAGADRPLDLERPAAGDEDTMSIDVGLYPPESAELQARRQRHDGPVDQGAAVQNHP